MSRAIIRAIWGKYDKSDRILARKKRVDGNIKTLMANKYNTPFITYCYGSENYDMLIANGIDKDSIRMVDDNNYGYDLIKQQYRHKMEVIRLAHEEFDIVLQMDFDVLPVRPFEDSIWDELAKKESFQANLYYYRRPKCFWRKIDHRKLCNGGFTYTRGKQPIEDIINIWASDANRNKRSCEPAMSMYVDKLHNGWIGLEEYNKLHEPEICNLRRNSPYGKYPNSEKPFFVHWAGLGSCVNEYLV